MLAFHFNRSQLGGGMAGNNKDVSFPDLLINTPCTM